MTSPKTLGAGAEGEARTGTEHHLTDEHWRLAAEAVTTGGTERDVVRAVALAIADAEDRVRFDSAFCPDCGVHVDNGPHNQGCPNQQGDHQ